MWNKMWNKFRRLMIGLLYENGEPSLTRFTIFCTFFVFVIGTGVDVWIVMNGKVWSNYATFATITGGGAIGGKIADKITNSMINSPKGENFNKSNNIS